MLVSIRMLWDRFQVQGHGKRSFPYSLKNLVRLTVTFIRIFPDIVSSYDDDEMSCVAHS